MSLMRGDEIGGRDPGPAERLRPASVVPASGPPARQDQFTGNDAQFRLADQLAPMVDVWERLLAAHQPDRTGRCRTCTEGGTGLPATRWPCSLHGLAELARRRHGLAEGA